MRKVGRFGAMEVEKLTVEKRNRLNEMRATSMSLQELRFIAIYLSKINPRDLTTRVVRFSMADFKAIMEIETRVNIDYIQKVTDSLLSKVINVPDERGGYAGFQIFQKCRVTRDDDDQWYIEIDAHDDALSLMFDFKRNYLTYPLSNILRLKSSNQIRMYEVLKQHEKIGFRILSVCKLRDLLGINKDEYTRFNDFKKWVLDSCQVALEKNTDISYVYESHGKKGRGGKILELKFKISKNKNRISPVSLDAFLEFKKQDFIELKLDEVDENGIVVATGMHWKYEERITFLMGACNEEFTREQVVVLFDIMPDDVKIDDNASHDYLQSKYREMDMRKPDISRFGYLKKIIVGDVTAI